MQHHPKTVEGGKNSALSKICWSFQIDLRLKWNEIQIAWVPRASNTFCIA